MTATIEYDAGFLPATEVYKSAAILALIPDDVDRYWARITGKARIHGHAVDLYSHGRCDWIGCYEKPVPNGPAGDDTSFVTARFCAEHRRAHGDRIRAQLIAAARATRARRAVLLASVRGIVDTSGS